MPPVSQAQRRWAFANKDKDTAEGRAAREYAESDPGGKLPEKKSPYDHARSKKARGEG